MTNFVMSDSTRALLEDFRKADPGDFSHYVAVMLAAESQARFSSPTDPPAKYVRDLLLSYACGKMHIRAISN